MFVPKPYIFHYLLLKCEVELEEGKNTLLATVAGPEIIPVTTPTVSGVALVLPNRCPPRDGGTALESAPVMFTLPVKTCCKAALVATAAEPA